MVFHAFFSLPSTLHADMPEPTPVVGNRAQVSSHSAVSICAHAKALGSLGGCPRFSKYQAVHSSRREEMQKDVCHFEQNVALMLF